MKFGKRLRSTLVQGWEAHYVDYTAIKGLIKVLTAPGSGHNPASQTQQFVQLLNQQLTAVNAFFQCEEAGIQAKWRSIDIAMIQSIPEKQMQAAREWLQMRLGKNYASHLMAGNAGNFGPSGLQLRLFCDVYDEAQQLRQYTAINFVAFIKGMKKFEKRTKLTISTAFMPRLQRSKFFVSATLAVLLSEMNNAARNLLQTLGMGKNREIAEKDAGDKTSDGSLCCNNPECGTKIDRVAIMLSCAHRLCWQCTALSCSFCSAEGEWACPACNRPQFLNPSLIYSNADAPLKTLVDEATKRREADGGGGSAMEAVRPTAPPPSPSQQLSAPGELADAAVARVYTARFQGKGVAWRKVQLQVGPMGLQVLQGERVLETFLYAKLTGWAALAENELLLQLLSGEEHLIRADKAESIAEGMNAYARALSDILRQEKRAAPPSRRVISVVSSDSSGSDNDTESSRGPVSTARSEAAEPEPEPEVEPLSFTPPQYIECNDSDEISEASRSPRSEASYSYTAEQELAAAGRQQSASLPSPSLSTASKTPGGALSKLRDSLSTPMVPTSTGRKWLNCGCVN